MQRRVRYLRIGFLIGLLGLFLSWPGQTPRAFGQDQAQIPTSAQEIRPLLIGAKVPQLTLRTIAGESFDLNAALAKQPTVLIFYRGGW